MAEKVARTHIKRDKDRMYFIKGQAVYSVPRGKKGAAHRKEASFSHDRNNDYIYFVDKQGDVARALKKQSRGRKRKSRAPSRTTSRSLSRAMPKKPRKARKVRAKTRTASRALSVACPRGPIVKRPRKAKDKGKTNPHKNTLKKALRDLDSMRGRLR